MNKNNVRMILIVGLLIAAFIIFFNNNQVGRLMYPIYYKQEIEISAKLYELDPLLIAAIIRVESNYKPTSESRKGAYGLMQIMPDTASWIVERAGYPVDTIHQLHYPEVNINLGAWYVRSLFTQYDSKLIIVLAAYNAGPGNVTRWLTDGTWDGLLDHIDQIPFGETRQYVQKVLFYYDKYQKFHNVESNLALN